MEAAIAWDSVRAIIIGFVEEFKVIKAIVECFTFVAFKPIFNGSWIN